MNRLKPNYFKSIFINNDHFDFVLTNIDPVHFLKIFVILNYYYCLSTKLNFNLCNQVLFMLVQNNIYNLYKYAKRVKKVKDKIK